MSKRILIVTDSLGAPRVDKENVSFDDSWVGNTWKHFTAQGHEVICITEKRLKCTAIL